MVSQIAVTNQTMQIWGIWKLRPAYSPETPNLGQNRWCLVPCDLEIWWITLENNRASPLCCFNLCATFHSHRWIWQMTLKNNRAPLLCYFKLCTSFGNHLRIQTGVTVRKHPIWVKIFLEPCDLEIWHMTLKSNRAPLLCCFKLCASFHNSYSPETPNLGQNRQFF